MIKILDNKKEILQENFKYSKQFVYCGKIEGILIEIKNDKVVFAYKDENKTRGYLTLYPFKKGELQPEIFQSSFKKVEQFLDYKQGYSYNSDFHQYTTHK